jgi:hypothetical protein
MKVYFGFTVTGNRSSVEAAKKIIGILESMGHEVFTRHLLSEDAWEADRRLPPQEVFARDMMCDIFIAEISAKVLEGLSQPMHLLCSWGCGARVWAAGVMSTMLRAQHIADQRRWATQPGVQPLRWVR